MQPVLQTFDTFREAGQFAARFCADHHTTASIKNIEGRWAVVPSDEYLGGEGRKAEQSKIEEQREAEETIRRVALEQQQQDERRAYFRTLSKDALQALWDHRDQPLSTQDFVIVRQVLRETLGITSAAPVNLTVCSQCFLVGDACTCH